MERKWDGTCEAFDAATYPPCCIWTFSIGITPDETIAGYENDDYGVNHGFVRPAPLPLHPRLAQPRGEPRAPPIWLDHHFEFFPAAISHVVVREATRAEEDLPPPLSTRLPFPLGRTFPSSRV